MKEAKEKNTVEKDLIKIGKMKKAKKNKINTKTSVVKVIIPLVALLCINIVNVYSQVTLTSKFVKVIRDQNAIPITGLDVDLYHWDTQTKAYDLLEDQNSLGTYYKDSVEHGQYDIYVNGQLRLSSIFHGANKMNYIADRFTDDMIQLVTEGIKDSAVVWDKLSEAVKDSIRKRRIGDYVWGLINWSDLSEAVKDSIRKNIQQEFLEENFIFDFVRSAHGIIVDTLRNGSQVFIGFDSTQSEKDTIYARVFKDDTLFSATRGNWVFKDTGCIKIYSSIGIDCIIQDTIIFCDTLSTMPLVLLCDTSIGNRYVDIPDTLFFDATECGDSQTIINDFCEDTLTIPILFRRIVSMQVIPSDTIVICDTVCTRYVINMKDTSFVVLTDKQMSEVRQIQRNMYGISCDSSTIIPATDPTMCVRKYNPDNWLVNMFESDINYPHRQCPLNTKCDTTSVCCIRKSVLNFYFKINNIQPITGLWIDTTKEVVDCFQYRFDPRIMKDSLVCTTIVNTPTPLYADTIYSYIGDTLITYNKCLYKCPSAYIVQSIGGYWDTTYSIIPVINSTLVGYDTIPADNDLNTWYVLIDSVETFFTDSYPTKEPWNAYPYTYASQATLDSLKLLWPYVIDTLKHTFATNNNPPYYHGYYPLKFATKNQLTNDIVYHNNLGWPCEAIQMYSELTWDLQLQNRPFHPYWDIYIWFPVDSLMNMLGCDTIRCGIKKLHTRGVYGTACYTVTYKLKVCIDPYSLLPSTMHIDTLWYHTPNNLLGIPCDDQIIPIYDHDTLRIDTLMYVQYIPTGGITSTLFMRDTCECSEARIIMPNGQSIRLCGDIYFRNDCVNGTDPYIENGNTVVFNYSCGSGGLTGIGNADYITKIEMNVNLSNLKSMLNDSIAYLRSEIERLENKIDSCCELSNGVSPITTIASMYYDYTGDSTTTNIDNAEEWVSINNANFVTYENSDISTNNGHFNFATSDTGYYSVTGYISLSSDKDAKIELIIGDDVGGTFTNTKITKQYLQHEKVEVPISTVVKITNSGKYGLYAKTYEPNTVLSVYVNNLTMTKLNK